MLRYISIVCLPHGIYSVRIHWELLVEFSCDLYKILFIEFILVTLLAFVTNSCHNISIDRVSWKSNVVHILMTDRLVYLILLGLIFIHLNQLIVDVKTGTVIDKYCKYNDIMVSYKTTILRTKKKTDALLE